MGGLLDLPQGPPSLPAPKKTYFPIPSADRRNGLTDQLASAIQTSLNTLRTVEVVLAAAGVYPPIFPIINATTSVIDYLGNLCANPPYIDFLPYSIRDRIAAVRNPVNDIKGEIGVIETCLREIQNPASTDEVKRINAIHAARECEKILNRFDNGDSSLWDMSVVVSPVLLPFSAICAQVIMINFRTQNCSGPVVCAKMAKQLLSILKDYKKKCILDRLNFVTVKRATWFNGGDRYVCTTCHHFQLGHSKFSRTEDLDYPYALSVCFKKYKCVDAWDKWAQQETEYESTYEYRRDLIRMYEADFDQVIPLITAILHDPTAIPEAETAYQHVLKVYPRDEDLVQGFQIGVFQYQHDC